MRKGVDMLYTEYRDAIFHVLRKHPEGMTWVQLKEHLGLPQKTACPTWTRHLEQEIGLRREKGRGRALVWKVSTAPNAAE